MLDHPLKIFICHHPAFSNRKEHLEAILFKNNMLADWVEKPEVPIGTIEGELHSTELSIYAKHQYCFNKIVEEEINLALILEDDADIKDDFPQYLYNCIIKFISSGGDMVMLGSCCDMRYYLSC